MIFCILVSLVTSSVYYKCNTFNAIWKNIILTTCYPYNVPHKTLFLYIIYEGSKHGYVMTMNIFI
jgi:hypothetical protein